MNKQPDQSSDDATFIDALAESSDTDRDHTPVANTHRQEEIAEVWTHGDALPLPPAPPMSERLAALIQSGARVCPGSDGATESGKTIPLDFADLSRIAAAGQDTPPQLPPGDLP